MTSSAAASSVPLAVPAPAERSRSKEGERRQAPALWQIALPSFLAAFLLWSVTHSAMALPPIVPESLLTVLCAIVLVPWLGLVFGKMKVGPVEVEARERVKKLENEFTSVKQRLDGLEVLAEAISHTLTDGERRHLERLRRGDSGGTVWNPNLYQEALKLCHHGFANEAAFESVHRLKDDPHRIFDLKDYIVIAPAGVKHLQIFEQMQAVRSASAPS